MASAVDVALKFEEMFQMSEKLPIMTLMNLDLNVVGRRSDLPHALIILSIPINSDKLTASTVRCYRATITDHVESLLKSWTAKAMKPLDLKLVRWFDHALVVRVSL